MASYQNMTADHERRGALARASVAATTAVTMWRPISRAARAFRTCHATPDVWTGEEWELYAELGGIS